TKPAFVDEAEVRHVEEVLDEARCARLDVVRAAVDLAHAGVKLGSEHRDGRFALRWRVDAHPNESACLTCRISRGAVRGRRDEGWQRRNMRASPARLESPTVIRAFELRPALAFNHAAERQLRSTVRAAVCPGVHCALAIAPEHEVLSQEPDGLRRISDF